MESYGLVLRSLPNSREGILVLLDDLESATAMAEELNAKGIEVDVRRLVKQERALSRQSVPVS